MLHSERQGETMATEFGVWSELDGGFLVAQTWSSAEAEKEREQLITDGEDPDYLTVMDICPDHEEQPRDGCEECNAEDDD